MADFLGIGPGLAFGPWWGYEIVEVSTETILYGRAEMFAVEGASAYFVLSAFDGLFSLNSDNLVILAAESSFFNLVGGLSA